MFGVLKKLLMLFVVALVAAVMRIDARNTFYTYCGKHPFEFQ